MKKLVTLLSALVVAVALGMPVYARPATAGAPVPHSKAHKHHAKKKGSKEGKKKGQEGTNPGNTSK